MVAKFTIITIAFALFLFVCSDQENSEDLPIFPELPQSEIIEKEVEIW